MKDIEQATACVIDSDSSLFLPVARRLARSFKRVLYHRSNSQGFPTIGHCAVGDGFEDIELCEDPWLEKREIDAFFFPDIGRSGLQLELESQGFPVWGSRQGDEMEIYRQKFCHMLGKLGLTVPKYTVCQGWTKLRDHLQDQEDKYIKISKYRGSMETKHWRSWKLDEGWLDVLAVRFGPLKERIPFLVFEPIKTPLEIGGDMYNIRGAWPKLCLHGIERKDSSYFAAVTPYWEMPEQILEITEAFGPLLAEYDYRNEWSSEIRVKDDKNFFTDPTQRGGLPSTSSQLEVWENFPEIAYAGANGEMEQPKPAAKFTMEAMLKLKRERGALWSSTEIPKEIEQWVKLTGCCMENGLYCFPNDEHDNEDAGWIVAVGDTPKETLDKIKEYAEHLPEGLTADIVSLAEAFKEVEEEEKRGIDFADAQLPEPGEVIS